MSFEEILSTIYQPPPGLHAILEKFKNEQLQTQEGQKLLNNIIQAKIS